ncbi:hypothetical protein [Sphingomonas sp. 10B4]|uniref:hypothetical protein n=1 Tax=Sphingomonas sp. 10B4 TaxID=3048575 RepID=UPI002AB56D08|nr:hypothetical protein [Sphingomonas sp. 10B4]MDY7526008.1 hypothetical protein [Sphingomonas sp. 10B4]MEB0284349.1 hypothetical protein [Sphingomonas sp. 10B4]
MHQCDAPRADHHPQDCGEARHRHADLPDLADLLELPVRERRRNIGAKQHRDMVEREKIGFSDAPLGQRRFVRTPRDAGRSANNNASG